MLYIGDVHGACRQQYLELIQSRSPKPSIQVGDLALGYPGMDEMPVVEGAMFIAGNHDNRDECQSHPNYLGDFGYWEEEEIFYISGAFSVDCKGRTPGYNFWFNEELNYREWNKVLELYSRLRPKIVVSHDCPRTVAQEFWGIHPENATSYNLQSLLSIHQPDLWVFGHHHQSKRGRMEGIKTLFICLGVGYETHKEIVDGEEISVQVQTGFEILEI